MGTEPITYTSWNSPIGSIFLLSKGTKLVKIGIGQTVQGFLTQLETKYQQPTEDTAIFEKPIQQLKEYFQQKRQNFNLDLDLAIATDFQQRVWKVLNTIPYGQTRSYKWVAQQAGKPKSARAVGTANRANPLPIIIPCHRVINANGELGGYSGGGQTIKKFWVLTRTAH